MGLGGEIKNAGAGGLGESEFGLVGVAIFGLFRDFAGGLILGMTVGLHRDGVVIGVGIRKVEGEGNRGGVRGYERNRRQQCEESERPEEQPGCTVVLSFPVSGYCLQNRARRVPPEKLP